MTSSLRPDLTALPTRITHLPKARGYPVPWFVCWIDGKPEFRVVDARKRVQAVNEHLCWVCGKRLGTYIAFVIGPMCAINRISSDPGMHRECATWSVQNCPFLTRPNMARRENDLPEGATNTGGIMIERNPGVTLLWVTKSYKLTIVNKEEKEWLIKLGMPREVIAYREGRVATQEEMLTSIETGFPELLQVAIAEGQHSLHALKQGVKEAAITLGLQGTRMLKLAEGLT